MQKQNYIVLFLLVCVPCALCLCAVSNLIPTTYGGIKTIFHALRSTRCNVVVDVVALQTKVYTNRVTRRIGDKVNDLMACA